MKSKKMPPPPTTSKAMRGVAREEMREGIGKKAAFTSAKKQIGGKAVPKKKGY